MRTHGLNPELQIMLSRAATEVNQAAIKADLKARYCRKAWACGMSLDGYCKRFGVCKLWEKLNESE